MHAFFVAAVLAAVIGTPALAQTQPVGYGSSVAPAPQPPAPLTFQFLTGTEIVALLRDNRTMSGTVYQSTSKFTMRFYPDGSVTGGVEFGPSGAGSWDTDGDRLHIVWGNGKVEKWGIRRGSDGQYYPKGNPHPLTIR